MKGVISTMPARKMLQKGCKGFLAHVREVMENKNGLKLIHVVKEFPNMFPKELPGLPPEREINFEIDLILGTRLISIPPYRMAPIELKDLKE